MYSIKDIVKNNTAEFSFFRNGIAYYTVSFHGFAEDEKYIFPVPVEDLQQATIFRTHKAIELMRYIRAALKEGTFVKSK